MSRRVRISKLDHLLEVDGVQVTADGDFDVPDVRVLERLLNLFGSSVVVAPPSVFPFGAVEPLALGLCAGCHSDIALDGLEGEILSAKCALFVRRRSSDGLHTKEAKCVPERKTKIVQLESF